MYTPYAPRFCRLPDVPAVAAGTCRRRRALPAFAGYARHGDAAPRALHRSHTRWRRLRPAEEGPGTIDVRGSEVRAPRRTTRSAWWTARAARSSRPSPPAAPGWPAPSAGRRRTGARPDQRIDAATTWSTTTSQVATHGGQLGGGRRAGASGRPGRWSRTRRRAAARRAPSARAAKTTPGPTGRLARHSAPRPSRHQALTPKSSAPPATLSAARIGMLRPRQLAGQRHDAGRRPPASPSPRRIGTVRQTEPSPARTSIARSLPGIGRAG